MSRSSRQRPGSAVVHGWGSSELRPSAQVPLISPLEEHSRSIAQEEERCTVRRSGVEGFAISKLLCKIGVFARFFATTREVPTPCGTPKPAGTRTYPGCWSSRKRYRRQPNLMPSPNKLRYRPQISLFQGRRKQLISREKCRARDPERERWKNHIPSPCPLVYAAQELR